MGFLNRLLRGEPSPLLDLVAPQLPAPLFSTDIDSGTLYGTPTIDDYIRGSARIGRREALTVPAVKRVRDLIAGGIGQFPLGLFDAAGQRTDWELFAQMEDGTAPSVTMTRLVEDLLFHGVAWLKVTYVGYHGRPVKVKRLDPATVTVNKKVITYRHGSAEEWIPATQVIRIDSPHDGLLVTGAKAIRTCLALTRTTNVAADALPPMSYFAPVDDSDPMDEDEIADLLDAWIGARKKYGIAYVPAALDLKTLGWSPEQLELSALRDQAVVEIARLASVDPEELGVSTTSRTYANLTDRRRDRLDFTLGPFMTAIEGRLSMPDVTPRGYHADFITSDFTRADDKTRAETDKVLIDAGILTVPEARAARGLDVSDNPTPARKEISA